MDSTPAPFWRKDACLFRNCFSVESSDYSFILIMFQHWYFIRKFLILKKCFNKKQEKNQCYDQGLLGIFPCEDMIFKFGDFANIYHARISMWVISILWGSNDKNISIQWNTSLHQIEEQSVEKKPNFNPCITITIHIMCCVGREKTWSFWLEDFSFQFFCIMIKMIQR